MAIGSSALATPACAASPAIVDRSTHFLEKPVDLSTIAGLAAQAGVASALLPIATRRLEAPARH